MFKTIYNLFIREVKSIANDKGLFILVIIAPLIYSFYYGTTYINKIEQNLDVTIVDNDMSQTSRKLASYLDATQMVDVNKVEHDINKAYNNFVMDETKAIVYIPNNFENNLKESKGATIKLYLNNVRFLASNDIYLTLNKVVGTINAGIRIKYLESTGLSKDQAMNAFEPVALDLRPMFNTSESYGDFILPGLIILVLHQLLLIAVAASGAKENELNTWGELSFKTGNSPFKVLTGKGTFYFIIYLFYFIFFMSVNFGVFNLIVRGSFVALLIVGLASIFALINLGFLVGTFLRKRVSAIQFIAFTSYPFLLMSGFSYPQFAMPKFIVVLSQLFPSTPMLDAVVRITQAGAGLADVTTPILHLLVMGVVFYILAAFRVSGRMKKLQTNIS